MALPPTKEGDIIEEPIEDLRSILVHLQDKHGYIPRHTFKASAERFKIVFLEGAESIEPETSDPVSSSARWVKK